MTFLSRRGGQLNPSGRKKLSTGRAVIFWLSLLYLLGLGVLAWLHFTGRLRLPGEIGSMPTAGILWFGALGGVLLSLTGVFDHPYDWDPGYRLWHVARPFVGAAVGLVAVLIIQAGVLTISQNPTKSGSQFALYYIVAFLVGYREETFREMIKRLADVILTPPPARVASPTLTSVDPAAGAAAGGESVTIRGTGLLGARVVNFGTTPAPQLSQTSDAEIVALTPPGTAGSEVPLSVITDTGSVSGLNFRYN